MTTPYQPKSNRKNIRYCRDTKDFEMSLDGQVVGFARTFQEAEETLDTLVYELLTHPVPTAEAIEAHRETLSTSADIVAMIAETTEEAA